MMIPMAGRKRGWLHEEGVVGGICTIVGYPNGHSYENGLFSYSAASKLLLIVTTRVSHLQSCDDPVYLAIVD